MKNLTFITGNPGKAEQLAKYLKHPINHHKLDLIEIQSLELAEVIEHKVKEAYKVLKTPVIVDDVAVIFTSLNQLPGPLIKWFTNGLGYEKVCQMLNAFEDRSAFAEVGIGFYDGKNLEIFLGKIKGSISDQPKGENGFGWDVIFIPDGYSSTRAQLEGEDYDKTSPRKIALDKFAEFVEKYDK